MSGEEDAGPWWTTDSAPAADPKQKSLAGNDDSGPWWADDPSAPAPPADDTARFPASNDASSPGDFTGKLPKETQAYVKRIQAALPQDADLDTAWDVVKNHGEMSGGQQFDSTGQPLTSPKGALGVAQVMPGTGPDAAKLAGEEWDPTRLATDQAYNDKLGKAYYAQQIKEFGDPVTAAAAYNAGPQRVRDALAGTTAAPAAGLTVTFPGEEAPTPSATTAAKPPEDDTDYVNMPWSDVLKTGVRSFPNAGLHMLGGIYETVVHPQDTAQTLFQLAKGVDSKIATGMGRPNPNAAQDEALLNALGQQYVDRYGSEAGVKKTMATNLPSLLLDASTVATLGGSAVEAAAKGVGTIGALSDVAGGMGAVGRGITKAGEVVNPLNPAGLVSKAVGKATGAFAPSASKVAGDTDTALNTLTATHTGMPLGVGDIDPAVSSSIAGTVAAKGVNQPAVSEGIINGLGGKTTRSMATGEIPTTAEAGNIHADAVAANRSAFGDNIGRTVLAKDAAPSTSDLVANFDRVRTNTFNTAISHYNDARAVPGGFAPGSLGGAPLMGGIQSQLGSRGIPGSIADLQNTPNAYEQTLAAINKVNNPATFAPKGKATELSGTNLMAIRNELGTYLAAAKGSDRAGVRSVIDAFDDHVADRAAGVPAAANANGPAATTSGWVGGDGQQFARSWQNGTAGYRDYMQTYVDPKSGVDSRIVTLSKKLAALQDDSSPAGYVTPANDEAAYQAYQGPLTKGLLDPISGLSLHNQLSGLLDDAGQAALDSHVRNLTLARDPVTGELANTPERIQNLISTPGSVPSRVFSDAEKNHISLVNTARKISDARPTVAAKHASIAHTVGSEGMKMAARYAALHLGAPFGPVGELAGLAGEQGAERVFGRSSARKAAALQKAGAPASGGPGPVRKVAKVLNPLRYPRALAQTANANAVEQRQPHASGGRTTVNHAARAAALVRAAETARRQQAKTTQPLLNQSDEAIARALSVANERI